jgi:hypothetical protein
MMNMADDSEGYTILTGLVELEGGILDINNLEISDILISGCSLIKVNEGSLVGEVNIIGSKFENI